MAITIGIAAKGQNVAHLVALAFAVAASANFPCVLLTLYWKRCNTGGIVLGMIVGTVVAVGLTLVSPNVTYPKATDLLHAAARCPVDRILLETDAPYLTPVPHRGTPNEPAFVMDTLRAVASVRGVDATELAEQVMRNAAEAYGLAT